MKITGQILRENREKNNISINEVSLATKINNKTLIAMESGDLGRLPPKTFLRGFVRAYAAYLHLDVNHILNTFQEEMGSTKPKAPPTSEAASKSQSPSSMPTDADDPKTSLIKYSAIAGIVILIVLIILIKKKMDSYQAEVHMAEPGPTTTSPVIEPPPPPEPDLITPIPTPVASPTAKPSPTPTAKPMATASPAAAAAPSPTPNAKAVAGPDATATPSPTPASKPQEVIIEALSNVEIDAQVDGVASKKIRLGPNQVHTIKAKRKVVLQISNGGAVNLVVNGTDRGVPGDLGKPSRVEYP